MLRTAIYAALAIGLALPLPAACAQGLVPLYLGGGLMWEPMAVSIMVGLLFATVITLLFVPVLYKILFRVRD